MSKRFTESSGIITASLPDGRELGVWFKPYLNADGHGYVNPFPKYWDDIRDSHDAQGHLIPSTRLNVRTVEAWTNTLVRYYPSIFGA